MKIFVYTMLGLAVALMIATIVLLTIAFSRKENVKRYEWAGYSFLALTCLCTALFLGFNKAYGEEHYDFIGFAYTSDETKEEFVITKDKNEYCLIVKNEMGVKGVERFEIDKCFLIETDNLAPYVIEYRAVWETKTNYYLYIPTNYVIL